MTRKLQSPALSALGLMLALGTVSCARCAEPPVAPLPGGAPPQASAPAPTMPPRAATPAEPAQVAGALPRAGVARTPEEIEACKAEEAQRAAEESRQVVRAPTQPVHLRGDPISLSLEGCAELVRYWNFYSDDNPGGCFVNAYRRNPEDDVIADLATGLAWQANTSEEALAFSGIGPYLAQLNKERSGGFSDWRLPTLEESFSLMESLPFDNTHQDKLLFVTRKELWTSDFYTPEKMQWTLFAAGPGCLPASRDKDSRYYVRAVRSSP